MHDHRRLLGALFIGWAALQLAVTVILAAQRSVAGVTATWGHVYWIVTALLIAAYLWVGVRLRARDARMRIPAIAFSVLALFSFPFGTVLGVYGLWALLRRPRAVTA